MAFSPDGRRIAGAGKRLIDVRQPAGSGEIKVWGAETGRELLTLQGHTGDVWRVAFSPDGQRLASASGGEVRVWDGQTGQQVLVLNLTISRARPVPARADAQTRQQTIALMGQGPSLAFSPDGHWLVGYRQFWDATPLPEEPQANEKAP
jgi:WD40 repeat protein